MKRLLSILIIALAFASCRNEREDVEPNVERSPIIFGEMDTRTLDAPVVGDEFGVFAYKNGGVDGTPEASIWANLLNQERVYWKEEDGNEGWTYDNIQFWELDRTFQFFAFHPYEEEFVTPVSNGTTDTGYELTVVTDQEAQYDLMTAGYTQRTQTGVAFPSQVSLDFNHEFVRVNVEVQQNFDKNPTQAFCVNYMSLSNIWSKGVLRIDGLGAGATRTWSFPSATPLKFEYEDANNTPLATDYKVLLRPTPMLLIPQSTGSINFTMNYKYAPTKVDGEWAWEPRTANINLPTGTWKAGTEVLYSITLYEDNEIVFTKVSVAPWGTNQSGGTIIIK